MDHAPHPAVRHFAAPDQKKARTDSARMHTKQVLGFHRRSSFPPSAPRRTALSGPRLGCTCHAPCAQTSVRERPRVVLRAVRRDSSIANERRRSPEPSAPRGLATIVAAAATAKGGTCPLGAGTGGQAGTCRRRRRRRRRRCLPREGTAVLIPGAGRLGDFRSQWSIVGLLLRGRNLLPCGRNLLPRGGRILDRQHIRSLRERFGGQ